MLEPWDDLADSEVLVEADGTFSLLGVRCRHCRRIDFPAVPFCRSCLGEDVAPELIHSLGECYAFTTVRTATDSYKVGYVDLPVGLRVFGHLDGPVAIGDEVVVSRAELPITFSRKATAR